MVDLEQTRQRFEDRCWQHYLSERARRNLPGDVDDEHPTREQLFWRQGDGTYGVLAFNTAWTAWCWAMGDIGEPVATIKATEKLGFPLLEWLSADHSFRAPIGSMLYALPKQ